MTLDHSEKHGALWVKLKAHLNDRLVTLRLRNDGNLSEVETARTRGRIAEIKMLLALEDGPEHRPDAPDGASFNAGME